MAPRHVSVWLRALIKPEPGNAQNRLAGTLGVRRVALDVAPTLEQYLAARAQEAPPATKEPDGDEGSGDDE